MKTEDNVMYKRYKDLQNDEQRIGYIVGWADAIEWKENSEDPRFKEGLLIWFNDANYTHDLGKWFKCDYSKVGDDRFIEVTYEEMILEFKEWLSAYKLKLE